MASSLRFIPVFNNPSLSLNTEISRKKVRILIRSWVVVVVQGMGVGDFLVRCIRKRRLINREVLFLELKI